MRGVEPSTHQHTRVWRVASDALISRGISPPFPLVLRLILFVNIMVSFLFLISGSMPRDREGSQCKLGQSLQRSVEAMRFARVLLLPCVALAVMMAGCVLVCSTFKGRRMHCKHERAANASLGSHSSQRRSDALRTSCCLQVLLLQ